MRDLFDHSVFSAVDNAEDHLGWLDYHIVILKGAQLIAAVPLFQKSPPMWLVLVHRKPRTVPKERGEYIVWYYNCEEAPGFFLAGEYASYAESDPGEKRKALAASLQSFLDKARRELRYLMPSVSADMKEDKS